MLRLHTRPNCRPLPHRRDHDIPVTLLSARNQAFVSRAAVADHANGSIITTAAGHGLTYRVMTQFANAKCQLDGAGKICDCFRSMAYQPYCMDQKMQPCVTWALIFLSTVFLVTWEPVSIAAETDARHISAAQHRAFCATRYLNNSCWYRRYSPRGNECAHNQILYNQCLQELDK